MNRNIKGFLSVLIFMIIVICLLFILPVPDNVTGTVHPVYKTMMKSGQNAVPETQRLLSYLFGAGIFGIIGFTLLLVTDHHEKDVKNKTRPFIIIAALGYLLVYVILVAVSIYFTSESPIIVLGFPLPTAWMLFGIGFYPVLFSTAIIINFKPWVISDNNLSRFKEIMQSRQKGG